VQLETSTTNSAVLALSQLSSQQGLFAAANDQDNGL